MDGSRGTRAVRDFGVCLLSVNLLLLVLPEMAMAQAPPPNVQVEAVRTDCEKTSPGSRGLRVEVDVTADAAWLDPGCTVDVYGQPQFWIGGTLVTHEYTLSLDPLTPWPQTVPASGGSATFVWWVDVSDTATTTLCATWPTCTAGDVVRVDGSAVAQVPGTGSLPSCNADADVGFANFAFSPDCWCMMRAVKNTREDLPDPLLGQLQTAHFGQALAAGDFDGDGDGDIAVGAPSEDYLGVPDAGAVHIYLTTVNPGGDLDWSDSHLLGDPSIQGPASGALFGRSLAAGDLDFDGIDDLVVAAPNATVGGQAGAGKVYVFYSPDFLNWSALPNPDPQVNAAFGASLDVGDMLTSPLVVGEPRRITGPGVIGGQVKLFWIHRTKPPPRWEWVYGGFLEDPNPSNLEDFGASVAVGDVNPDGFDDLLVGAPGAGLGAEGRAFYFVNYGSCYANPLEIVPPGTPGAPGGPNNFGQTVALGERTTPVGPGILAVGDPTHQVGGVFQRGWRVTIYDSAGTICQDTCPTPTTICPAAQVGEAVDPFQATDTAEFLSLSFGDIDGDNFLDLVVGADVADPCLVHDAGTVFVDFLVDLIGGTGQGPAGLYGYFMD